MNKKLAIITTHPIQYYAPLFKLLAQKEIEVKVFYTWGNVGMEKFDPGFGKQVEWDIPLLEGYNYTFVKNTSKKSGSGSFFGIQNPSLIKEIMQHKPDAILFFGWAYISHLRAMAYFKGKIPVYFRGDSTLLDEQQGFKTLLRRMVLRQIYKFVDFVFYVGSNNKKYFLVHGLNENQLIFAPHAIDNDRFSDQNGKLKEMSMAWKSRLNIALSDLVFLFVGKFESKKDPLLLLNAWLQLNLENAHLIFIGNGLLEKEMKQLAQNNSNIHFIEFQNQSSMPAAYRLGDIICLPSKGPGETWGLAINEAMASGLGVLASTRCGCATDLVEDGVNGYIFKSEDIDDLKHKISLVASEFSKLNFGKNSMEMINHWSLQKAAEAIFQAIKEN